MRLLSLDSLSPLGETIGKISFLAHTDGGLAIEVEQWADDYDDHGEPAPAIFVAAGQLSDDDADVLRVWLTEVVK